MAKWVHKKGFRPEQILQKLNSIISIEPQNNGLGIDLRYPDYSYDGLKIVLSNMLELSSEISESKKAEMLTNAIKGAKQKGDLTENNLLGEITKLENIYLAQPQSDYVLASYISADGWFNKPKLANRQINSAMITFTHELPKNFLTEHQKVRELAKDIIDRKFPNKYQAVRVKIAARTASDAVENALNRLALLRAIWNFAINRNSGLHPRWSGGTPMPINPLVLGPLHTVHKPTGELATDITQWWYEPSYIMPVFRVDLNMHAEAMYKWEKIIRTQLNRLPYRSELESILIQYAYALDGTQWHTSFLLLWSILEQLTSTVGNYDKTIKRTAFLFEDTEYHEQILNHLRRHRNDLVHDGKISMFFESLTYQAKYYVDQLLKFYFTNSYRFASLYEVSEMFDYPTVAEKLKNQLKFLENVIKFRNID